MSPRPEDEGQVYVGNRGTVIKGSDPILDTNEYDFEVALRAAEKRKAERDRIEFEKAVAVYDERFKTNDLWREVTYPNGKPIKSSARPDPTSYADNVLPLDAFRSTAPQGRHTTPDLQAQVVHLRSRRLQVEAIADLLNLKDSRVRSLLRQAAS